MKFFDYQLKTKETAIYKKNLELRAWKIYPVLGLLSEAGEVADKVKKVIRDKNGEFSFQDYNNLKKEVGDCLWYLAQICNDFGFDLEEIAEQNLNKLRKRKEQNKISGSGDDRENDDYDQCKNCGSYDICFSREVDIHYYGDGSDRFGHYYCGQCGKEV
jgi:NTP pyrophosphatase (non-canonical NTP hydrolase)